MGQCLPCGKFLTTFFSLLPFFITYLSHCLSNLITCRFSLMTRQLFFQSFSSTCSVVVSQSVIAVSKWHSRNWWSISLSYINNKVFQENLFPAEVCLWTVRDRPLPHTASLTIKMVWIFLGQCCGTTSNLCFLVFSQAKLFRSYFSVRVLRDRCLQEKVMLCLWDVLFLCAVVSSSPDFV